MKQSLSQKQYDKNDNCDLCGRIKHLTFHHLIPRTLHTNKWFKKNYKRIEMKFRGLFLCKDCHDYLHNIISEKELGRNYNTKESLMANEKIIKFIEYIRKQK